MIHTQKCLDDQKKGLELNRKYEETWPNYCRTCRGEGEFISYESVPWGSTYASMEVFNFCKDCTELGICPRCSEIDLQDDKPCIFCGWNYGDAGLLYEFDGICDCAEEELDRLADEEYKKEKYNE